MNGSLVPAITSSAGTGRSSSLSVLLIADFEFPVTAVGASWSGTSPMSRSCFHDIALPYAVWGERLPLSLTLGRQNLSSVEQARSRMAPFRLWVTSFSLETGAIEQIVVPMRITLRHTPRRSAESPHRARAAMSARGLLGGTAQLYQEDAEDT